MGLEQGNQHVEDGWFSLLLLVVQQCVGGGFAQQLQVGVVEHEFEEGGVFVGQALLDLFLLVLPFASLLCILILQINRVS